jgi:polyferredoxin
MKKKESLLVQLEKEFMYHPKHVAVFFFGFGVAFFLLNIISFAAVWPFFNMAPLGMSGPLVGYYMSAVASVLIILYATYNIYTK